MMKERFKIARYIALLGISLLIILPALIGAILADTVTRMGGLLASGRKIPATIILPKLNSGWVQLSPTVTP